MVSKQDEKTKNRTVKSRQSSKGNQQHGAESGARVVEIALHVHRKISTKHTKGEKRKGEELEKEKRAGETIQNSEKGLKSGSLKPMEEFGLWSMGGFCHQGGGHEREEVLWGGSEGCWWSEVGRGSVYADQVGKRRWGPSDQKKVKDRDTEGKKNEASLSDGSPQRALNLSC